MNNILEIFFSEVTLNNQFQSCLTQVVLFCMFLLIAVNLSYALRKSSFNLLHPAITEIMLMESNNLWLTVMDRVVYLVLFLWIKFAFLRVIRLV